MRRREFITLIGGAAAMLSTLSLFAAWAQQSGRTRRIGILLSTAAGDPEFERRVAVLTQALHELGWTAGQSVVFETRYAEGKPERLPALAVELIKTNLDVIVTQGGEAIDAARNASNTIPVVMASVGDAVGQGIVASLARPGGNVTGLSLFATEQGSKRLELLKELLPGLGRIAVFSNGSAVGHQLQLREMERAAPVLRLALQSLPIRTAAEIDAAFQAAMEAGAQAIVTMEDPLIQFHRARIVDLSTRHRLPVMSEFRPTVVTGGLMSYGPNQIDMWRRAAAYVHKILNGANPGDLPIELPIKFELVINLKTAKALGIEIPPTLLARADEVIE